MLEVVSLIIGLAFISFVIVFVISMLKRRFVHKVSQNNKVKELEERIEKLEKR